MENTTVNTFMPYEKPPELSTWETIKTAIWDPETKSVFGRTGKNWAKLGLFYTIFYLVLAAFCAICLQGLLAVCGTEYPRYTLDSSIIGTNPGLGFRPIADDVETEGSLIWYVHTNDTEVKIWTDRLDKFLEAYRNKTKLPGGGKKQVPCNYTHHADSSKGEVCSVPVDEWGDCSPENKYGFRNATPCIFLKLNKIFDWVPDVYNNVNELPEDMPEKLKSRIQNLTDTTELNNIWVSCEGENPADKEHVSKFQYFPERGGFPGYYYPYKNVKDYLSPLVAVKLVDPKPNVLINIECRTWAKNIQYIRRQQERQGMVHFEIMID